MRLLPRNSVNTERIRQQTLRPGCHCPCGAACLGHDAAQGSLLACVTLAAIIIISKFPLQVVHAVVAVGCSCHQRRVVGDPRVSGTAGGQASQSIAPSQQELLKLYSWRQQRLLDMCRALAENEAGVTPAGPSQRVSRSQASAHPATKVLPKIRCRLLCC